MDMIAPPVGLGLSAATSSTIERSAPMHSVNRTNKGDRLRAPTADVKKPLPQKAPAVMVGCDPAVSPLSASVRATVPGRCLAGLANDRTARG
jgi:hypothetical protein